MKVFQNKYVSLSVLFLIVLFVLGFGLRDRESKYGAVDNASVTRLKSPESLMAVIDSVHSEINEGKYGLIDRFMVIQRGKVLADHKYKQDYELIARNHDTINHQYNYNHPSWHPYYKETELHTLQSVTKSLTSVLLGIALDENSDYSVKTKVMPLFKNYNSGEPDKRKDAIRIEDLLTMRSGLSWDEDDAYTDVSNDCIQMEASNNWIEYVLTKPMDSDPGTNFEYNSGASVLLGKIVRIITGERIDKWAEEKLFGPLGITEYYWKKTPKGEVDTEGGLYLKSEDLAKIGALFLDNGRWADEQIISEKWVQASTTPMLKDVEPNYSKGLGYGYQWWIPEHYRGKGEVYAGNGYGGQFLMMVPQYDLIVVFNGWNINSDPEKSSWFVLQDRLLPVLSSVK